MEENIKKSEDKNNQKYDELTNAPLTDHDYDGIRELDNDLPSWWRYLFYFTILVAVGYLMKYHVFKQGMTQAEEYLSAFPQEEETEAEETIIAEVEVLPLTDGNALSEGQVVFKQNCAVCHLEQGQGLVGPNLTDEYWIHGGSYKDILHTINEGVPLKGMISWKLQLPKKDIERVASYIWSIYGSDPPNPKKPEGELFTRQ